MLKKSSVGDGPKPKEPLVNSKIAGICWDLYGFMMIFDDLWMFIPPQYGMSNYVNVFHRF
jgi:hypothetical protein